MFLSFSSFFMLFFVYALSSLPCDADLCRFVKNFGLLARFQKGFEISSTRSILVPDWTDTGPVHDSKHIVCWYMLRD